MPEKNLPHDHGHSTDSVIEMLPSSEDFATVSEIFRQLGDPSRIRIFWILCHCEECVINLSAMVSMSSPAVSHHLRQLKTSGLITSRREGKEVYYRAAATSQAKLLHIMIENMVEITCPEGIAEHVEVADENLDEILEVICPVDGKRCERAGFCGRV